MLLKHFPELLCLAISMRNAYVASLQCAALLGNERISRTIILSSRASISTIAGEADGNPLGYSWLKSAHEAGFPEP
jgi:hypothetical protein